MMQSMPRRFRKAQTADESQVSVLMKDFDEADKMLQKLIDSTKAWRDSWRDILAYQERMVAEFHGLYKHIPGAGPDHIPVHDPVPTPQDNVDRVAKLQAAYTELKDDMLEEVNQMDTRIIRPAMDAKESIQPLKKVIKKRQDRKLDFERAQSKHDTNNKKMNRTEKERAALGRSESDFTIAKQEYEVADEKLRTNLPPLISAAFSLLPRLLTTQIMIQNNLLGHYYTQLHNYCTDEGFPSPPPPMSEIISVWQNDFISLQQQVETGFNCISTGKAVRQPLHQERQASLAVSNGNGVRKLSNRGTSPNPSLSPARSETSIPPSPNYGTKPPPLSSEPDYLTRISSVPSQGSLALSMPNYGDMSPSPGNEMTSPQSHAPAGPRADYFSRDRQSSQHLAVAAAQKKRPPPPPPKRGLSNQGMFVTALYDFAGQGQGDLAFREGDRIKVIKKTESTDDWWEGELGGVRGPFPANYCKA